MPRVPRAKSNHSQHRAASTAQAATVSSQQTEGRTRGLRWTTTTTTRVPATISDRSRGRPPTRRVAEQPRIHLSPLEDPASLGRSRVFAIGDQVGNTVGACGRAFATSSSSAWRSGTFICSDRRVLSAFTSVTTGDVLAIPALRMGTSSSAETGLGGCLGASTVYVYV